MLDDTELVIGRGPVPQIGGSPGGAVVPPERVHYRSELILQNRHTPHPRRRDAAQRLPNASSTSGGNRAQQFAIPRVKSLDHRARHIDAANQSHDLTVHGRSLQ